MDAKPQAQQRLPLPEDLLALMNLLAQLRRTQQSFLFKRLSWLCASAATLAPVAAVVALSFFGHPYWAVKLAWTGAMFWFAAAILMLLARAWQRRPARPLVAVDHAAVEARRLSALAPQLGSSVASAVIWAHEAHALLPGTLAAAHIAATRQAVDAAEPLKLMRRLHGRRLRPLQRGLVRLVVLLFGVGLATPTATRQLWDALRGLTPLQNHDQPLFADVEVSVRPPHYSGLPETTWAPMGGELQVLCGSTVLVRGRTSTELTQGLVAFGDAPWQPWHKEKSGLWQTAVLVHKSFSLRMAFIDSRGIALVEPTQRIVVAVADGPPAASIDAPTSAQVLMDHESLTVRWRATDDLKVARVSLWVAQAGAPPDGNNSIQLPLEGQRQRRPRFASDACTLCDGDLVQGEVIVDAHKLGLRAGPGKDIYVAAEDNAPTPQKTLSAPVHIALFSERAHHEELLLQQDEVLHALVDTYALEIAMRMGPTAKRTTSPLQALVAQAQTTQHLVHKLSQALQDDPLCNDDERLTMAHIDGHITQGQKQLQLTLASLTAASFAAQQAKFLASEGPHRRRVHTLEGDIVYLDHQLARSRLDVLQDHVRDLMATKAELQDLIERYRQTQDPTIKAQLAQRMAALKQDLQQLLQKMAAQKPQVEDAFVNAEATQQDPWQQTMHRLDRAMADNDIDALAQDLEHMANMVDNAAADLQQKQDEDGQSLGHKLRQQLQDLASTVHALDAEQQELQKESQTWTQEALQHAAAQQMQSRKDQHDVLAKLLQKVQAQLADAQHFMQVASHALQNNAVDEQALAQSLDALKDARTLLQQNALPQALLRLQQSEALVPPPYRLHGAAQAGLQKAKEALHEAQRTLQKLLQDAQQSLSQKMQSQAKATGDKQRALQQQTEQAQASAEQLEADAPILGHEASERLQQAQQAMKMASDAFSAGSMAEGVKEQQQARGALQALQQALQGSMGNADKTGSTMPRPAGAPRSGGQPRGNNFSNKDQNVQVEIPKAAQNDGDRWREQLLDYAKQAPPANFEEPVRRYYDALMR